MNTPHTAKSQSPAFATTGDQGLTGHGASKNPAGRPARKIGSAPLRPLPAIESDWQAGSGIVDQMLAYRDWWNLPARKKPGANKV